jgi:hypothetical protein
MDFREYKTLYQQLLSDKGRAELGDDPIRIKEAETKIERFLEAYPKVIPADLDPSAPFLAISLKELYRRMLRVSVDIINDIADAVALRDTVSATVFRRKIVSAFTAPDRRIYVGAWFIILSFILYFIDSAA